MRLENEIHCVTYFFFGLKFILETTYLKSLKRYVHGRDDQLQLAQLMCLSTSSMIMNIIERQFNLSSNALNRLLDTKIKTHEKS